MTLADDLKEQCKPMTVDERVRADRALAASNGRLRTLKEKYDHLEEQFLALKKQSEFVESIQCDVVDETIQRVKPSGTSSAVLLLSDWHVEESIDPKTVNGLNEFNMHIAEKRICRTFEKALMLIEHVRSAAGKSAEFAKIDELVVWLGGDLITGYIHPDLETSNNASPTEAVKFLIQLIVPRLRDLRLQTKIKNMKIVTSDGNHGRTTVKKRIATASANSYEWLMYHVCAMMMDRKSDAGIQWKIEKSYHNWLTIQGHECRFHHGDHMKYQGGVGGITIPVLKAMKAWNATRNAAFDFFGHFHQHIVNNRFVANSSLIGFGPYSIAIKAEYEVPSQTLVILNRKHGNILTQRVLCD